MALLNSVRVLAAVAIFAVWCNAATLAADGYEQFTGHGLSFSYAREMTIDVEAEDDQLTITVDSADSPFAVIQVQAIAGPLSEYRDHFTAVYRAALKEQGAVVSKEPNPPTRHVLFGTKQSAEVLKYRLLGSEFHVALLVARQNGRTFSILLQHEPSDADLAERYFKTIVESLTDAQ